MPWASLHTWPEGRRGISGVPKPPPPAAVSEPPHPGEGPALASPPGGGSPCPLSPPALGGSGRAVGKGAAGAAPSPPIGSQGGRAGSRRAEPWFSAVGLLPGRGVRGRAGGAAGVRGQSPPALRRPTAGPGLGCNGGRRQPEWFPPAPLQGWPCRPSAAPPARAAPSHMGGPTAARTDPTAGTAPPQPARTPSTNGPVARLAPSHDGPHCTNGPAAWTPPPKHQWPHCTTGPKNPHAEPTAPTAPAVPSRLEGQVAAAFLSRGSRGGPRSLSPSPAAGLYPGGGTAAPRNLGLRAPSPAAAHPG